MNQLIFTIYSMINREMVMGGNTRVRLLDMGNGEDENPLKMICRLKLLKLVFCLRFVIIPV